MGVTAITVAGPQRISAKKGLTSGLVVRKNVNQDRAVFINHRNAIAHRMYSVFAVAALRLRAH